MKTITLLMICLFMAAPIASADHVPEECNSNSPGSSEDALKCDSDPEDFSNQLNNQIDDLEHCTIKTLEHQDSKFCTDEQSGRELYHTHCHTYWFAWWAHEEINPEPSRDDEGIWCEDYNIYDYPQDATGWI